MMAPKFEWSVFQIHSQKIWLRQGHTFKKLRVCDTFDFFSTAEEYECECIRLRNSLTAYFFMNGTCNPVTGCG